ncbi:DUF6057 family protein [uncultured Draconibacterium sp.]|uniref:DUF6057 family protein n=1 Tax=uncultured Draconibacterium sp. TaxID=1573823 RepID=UPI003216975B
MNVLNHKSNRTIEVLPFVLFFLMGTFFLYYYSAYIFFYQEKSILFQLSLDYLQQHLNQPGGFLIYLGKLQTTFYYYPFIGSLLVVLELCFLIWLLQKTGKLLSGRSYYFIPFLLGGALFYLQINYQYLAFNNLGILLQLFLFYIFVRCKKSVFLWGGVILFPGIYFLFGSFSFLLLAMLAFYLIQKKEWIKLAAIFVVAGLFFLFGKELLFFQTTATLLQYPFAAQDIGGQLNVFVLVAFILTLLPLLFKIEFRKLNTLSIRKMKLMEFTPFVLLILLVLLVIPRVDKKNSHYFHVEKLFYEQKYNEIIQFNAQFPSTNILTAFLNNVALSETGQLANSFFQFPQTQDASTLFQKWEMMGEVLRKGGYFYYSIGMINEAQRWAYEYMVMRGLTPEILKMLIKTELINGNYEVADKYISILKRSIFYRDLAKNYEALLFNDAAINNDSELGLKKALKPKMDFFVLSDDPVVNLDLLLRSDSTNVFTLEYKLVYLMLQKDMKGVVDLLPVMEKAGYTQIPRNVEEAVVSYKLLKIGEMPELNQLRIRPETEQGFQQFYKLFQQNRSNKQQAQRALARDFANTYWYYVFFG